MYQTATLADVISKARDLEIQRRDTIRTAIAAHLGGNVSANELAAHLGATIGGPGWGRDRILAYLAAARNARDATRALARADLRAVYAADTDTAGEPDTAALLYAAGPQQLGTEQAKAILAALATAGLTVDAGRHDPEAALAILADREALRLTRVTAMSRETAVDHMAAHITAALLRRDRTLRTPAMQPHIDHLAQTAVDEQRQPTEAELDNLAATVEALEADDPTRIHREPGRP